MAYIGNSPANVGNYQLLDSIASSFNGSQTSFALASGGSALTPAKSSQLLINISGVMQQPDDSGTNGFLVNATNIVFSSAPLAADTFWGVYLGQSVDVGTVSNDTIATAQIRDAQVTVAKMAVNSIDSDQYVDGSIDTAHIANDQITAALMADNSIDSDMYVDGSIDTAHVADGAITAVKIHSAVELGGPSLGTASVIRTNAQTISENITIPSTSNGMSAGPITIANTYTVTVNGNWTII